MKQITIFLSCEEWNELIETVRHELGELVSDDEIERKAKREIDGYIRARALFGELDSALFVMILLFEFFRCNNKSLLEFRRPKISER